MERTRKSFIENNRLLAQENIEKETRFFDLRNTLLKMYQEAKDLKLAIEEMQDKNPHLKPATADLDSIQAVLEAAAREAEDASEVRLSPSPDGDPSSVSLQPPRPFPSDDEDSKSPFPLPENCLRLSRRPDPGR